MEDKKEIKVCEPVPEKKTWLDKIRDRKNCCDNWADNHAVLGFPYRHPLLFGALLAVCVFVVACCCRGPVAANDDYSTTSEVYESAPPVFAAKKNANKNATLDGYSDFYYMAGPSCSWRYGSGAFDYETQSLTITGYSNQWGVVSTDRAKGLVYDDMNYFAVVEFSNLVNGFKSSYGVSDLGIALLIDAPANMVINWGYTLDYDTYMVVPGVHKVASSSRYIYWAPPNAYNYTSTSTIGIGFSFDSPATETNVKIRIDFLGIETSTLMQFGNTYYNASFPAYVRMPSVIPSVYVDASNYDARQQGYDIGHNIGFQEGVESCDDLIASARAEGEAYGRQIGYQEGQTKNLTLVELFWYVIDEPFAVIYRLLDFDVLGINIFGFVCGLVTLGLIGFVIKLVL